MEKKERFLQGVLRTLGFALLFWATWYALGPVRDQLQAIALSCLALGCFVSADIR